MHVKTNPASTEKQARTGRRGGENISPLFKNLRTLLHLLPIEQTASESRGNVTYPVEKDVGDALSEVWAHEPLKGLFVPPLAWIITLRSPVMYCRWYMGPHLLLLGFHLLAKSPINKKTQAANRIAAYPTTAGSDPSLRRCDLFGEHGSQVPICL